MIHTAVANDTFVHLSRGPQLSWMIWKRFFFGEWGHKKVKRFFDFPPTSSRNVFDGSHVSFVNRAVGGERALHHDSSGDGTRRNIGGRVPEGGFEASHQGKRLQAVVADQFSQGHRPSCGQDMGRGNTAPPRGGWVGKGVGR